MEATTPDGARVAYEVVGKGPPLVLLHGGFIQDRRSWSAAGYVERLKDEFRLFVVDLRGHGGSDKPTAPEGYTAAATYGDVLAVLDAEGVSRARVWGYSFGASVALQLATATDRVERLALGGAGLGPWLTKDAAERTALGIASLAAAKARGELDALPVPEVHKEFARDANLEVAAAAFRGLAAWPIVEPEALRCPAFFYAGSENPVGAQTLRTYDERLRKAGARWTVLEGLDHTGEFHALERVLPPCADFLRERLPA